MVVGKGQPRRGERLAESRLALGGRPNARGAAHDTDAAVAKADKLVDRLRHHLAVVRRHAMPRVVEQLLADADLAPAPAFAARGTPLILGNLRQQHRADRSLLFA